MSAPAPIDEAAAAALQAQITELLRVVNVAQTILIAMFAVGIWDWLVCFKQEYERVWKSRWSLVKCLYLGTRYSYLISLTYMTIAWNYKGWSEGPCRANQGWSQPFVALWMEIFPECILLVRTLAVWSYAPWVLWSGLAVLGFDVACWIYTIAVGMEPIPFIEKTWYCIDANKGDHEGWLFWLGPLVFDIFVTGLLVIKVVPIVRQKTHSDMFPTLLREGLIFFFVITISNAVNLAFFLQTTVTANAVNVPISITLTTCLACRLVLSLRDPAVQKAKNPTPSTFWKQDGTAFSKPLDSTAVNTPATASRATSESKKPHHIELSGISSPHRLQYGFAPTLSAEKPTEFHIRDDDEDGKTARVELENKHDIV